MIDILYASELYERAKGEGQSENQDRKAEPTNEWRQFNLEWVLRTKSEPRQPENEHHCQYDGEDRLALGIDLLGLFEHFVSGSNR